ncbi:MAG: 5-oxoprolinase subunit PxpB [Bacteroidales bacterium]|nr:5-oxoprolinase subunit PxpB [Bacteroidales bacterium]TFH50185.1 MAG: 5-oxoprolinase subunit PxpB [Bacteroidia bacterium]
MLHYIPSGDSAFIIKAGDGISEEVNKTVMKLLVRLEEWKIAGITDFIPAYNELMVSYDPAVTGYRQILEILRACGADIEDVELPEANTVDVPVLYGGEYGPDIHDVADNGYLSPDDVVTIHSSALYRVYMLGFTPGFCYLGGMDNRITTPRRQSPRVKTPAGSVGIAGNQTGIYPVESPGGWNLIGRTPLKLFNPFKKPEFLLSAGDSIRFVPVTENEFNIIREKVENGLYQVNRGKQV